MYKVNYPTTVVTIGEKWMFLQKLYEALRRDLNAKGKQFRDGVITEAQFRNYQAGEFMEKEDAIMLEINALRKEVRENITGIDISTSLIKL